MTSEAAGASKRHDDHSAVGSLVERPVRPAAEARWYCLDRDGVAMLCKDEADARAQVIENDDCWPGRAPHRAALLGDVSAADAHIPMARLIELETAEHERDILRTNTQSLAMMLRKCAHRLKCNGHEDLSADVVGLLRRYGLIGSPLRGTETEHG